MASFFDELVEEHQTIERVVGALRSYLAARAQRAADESDGERFVTFFRVYAGAWHHEREERQLFEALTRLADLPGERGPIAVLTRQHRTLEGFLEQLSQSLALPVWSADDALTATRRGDAYADLLLHHIDAENSVLLPESQARLLPVDAATLVSRPHTDEETRALALGLALAQRYPPTQKASLLRGDGCVMCPEYTVGCRGLEREWWSAEEWERLEQGVGVD